MASAIFTTFICRQQRFLTLTRSPGKIRNSNFHDLISFKIVATQLWTRLASTSVQQQQAPNKSRKRIYYIYYYLQFNFFLADLQHLKNLKVDYQDGIAVVQFNQENSKVHTKKSNLFFTVLFIKFRLIHYPEESWMNLFHYLNVYKTMIM